MTTRINPRVEKIFGGREIDLIVAARRQAAADTLAAAGGVAIAPVNAQAQSAPPTEALVQAQQTEAPQIVL